MIAPLHVVFGAGQVGQHLARALAARGFAVRVARRGAGEVPPGAELLRGDAADAAFCAEAARGAAAVYHCMNPPYSARAWADLVPRFATNLARAAGGAGARLVVLDNLYALGRTGGHPMREDTPPAPVSRKGEIRARTQALLAEAQRRGEVRAVVGRASDFYGPGGEQSFFGPRFWPAALGGRPVTWIGNPDTPHSYHFIPDVARALAALGTADDDVLGRTFMLPCAPAEPTRALVARLSAALGREIRLRVLPRPLVRAIALAVPIVRELDEMLYQWEEPFVVDDRRFRARFPELVPVAPDAGATETVAWARERFGADR
ncbi:NAD-dependent epimerase/dehydratase family protein [Anaeromyxobacter sp. Fw109-5]|uniref:NAD-dependent epimerase/dehydratase family protein n=1 Tax=Anaeromyxobacter sp. (strain Fw109-5) TaxID=404589 RepID=UPI000158A677|nr:NAD-dependent epimerase/dehydratase family protein [Anaeromyxobacter sp. Fw109-5]ABS24266.1 NAD-dependent epimerase/dehydratase [Anaeromyxobacter sp. Fw109-5]